MTRAARRARRRAGFEPAPLPRAPDARYVPVEMMPAEEVRARILAALPGAHVEVSDMTGTSDHFDAVVIAPQFEGRSRIEQHQMVYRALGEAMTGPIHALALKTQTPDKSR